uniref:Uncharacterized protein n=1 Tax=Acrobeloides nanus TaxID=290746 RepID=A0A914CMG2_9BILA
MIGLPLLAGISCNAAAYVYMRSEAENLVICSQSEFVRAPLKTPRYIFNLTISGCLVIIYVIIWVLVKTIKKPTTHTKKILTSLTVITLLTVGTWPASKIINGKPAIMGACKHCGAKYLNNATRMLTRQWMTIRSA